MSLGKKLKYEREKHNWSQHEVAKKIGISNTVLSNYERDYRDPDTNTLKALADIYDVSIDYLLERDDSNNQYYDLTKKDEEVLTLLGQRIKYLRNEHKMTQEELGKVVHVTKVSISGYENGTRKPDTETLQKIADFFDVSIDYLLGRTDKKNYFDLTEKDEKDIAKQLEKMLDTMDDGTALAFDGEPMDDNTKDLVRAAIESNLRLTKQLAKKKFTPKKYRDRE